LPVVEVSVGDVHACARDGAGNVECWGAAKDVWNPKATLPDGRLDVPAAYVGKWMAVSVGPKHTCGLVDVAVSQLSVDIIDNIVCWGMTGFLQV
jgi:hypothetical protein